MSVHESHNFNSLLVAMITKQTWVEALIPIGRIGRRELEGVSAASDRTLNDLENLLSSLRAMSSTPEGRPPAHTELGEAGEQEEEEESEAEDEEGQLELSPRGSIDSPSAAARREKPAAPVSSSLPPSSRNQPSVELPSGPMSAWH